MKLPPTHETVRPQVVYILKPHGRHGRSIDDSTEQFIDETRMGTGA